MLVRASVSLDQVRARIAAAADRSGRQVETVRLVVVSKGQSPAAIRRLYEVGQRDFGENRAQELAAKVGELPSDIVWHFVGPLQTNKVRVVRPAVQLLHSLDRPDLVGAWVKGPGAPPPVLVQVRIGGEASKQGVEPAEALGLCELAVEAGIEVAGLMTIPPPVADASQARSFFEQLASISAEVRRRVPRADELSMGMTDDFEVAVEAGATIVRIGRAIFEELPN